MAQQTAVDYLIDNIHLLHSTIWNEIIEQAKAMEKEQITQAHLFGLLSLLKMEATKQAEEYYNKTYNK